jgi:hypothetical protein
VQGLQQESRETEAHLQEQMDQQERNNQTAIVKMEEIIKESRHDGQQQRQEMQAHIDALMREIRDYR